MGNVPLKSGNGVVYFSPGNFHAASFSPSLSPEQAESLMAQRLPGDLGPGGVPCAKMVFDPPVAQAGQWITVTTNFNVLGLNAVSFGNQPLNPWNDPNPDCLGYDAMAPGCSTFIPINSTTFKIKWAEGSAGGNYVRSVPGAEMTLQFQDGTIVVTGFDADYILRVIRKGGRPAGPGGMAVPAHKPGASKPSARALVSMGVGARRQSARSLKSQRRTSRSGGAGPGGLTGAPAHVTKVEVRDVPLTGPGSISPPGTVKAVVVVWGYFPDAYLKAVLTGKAEPQKLTGTLYDSDGVGYAGSVLPRHIYEEVGGFGQMDPGRGDATFYVLKDQPMPNLLHGGKIGYLTTGGFGAQVVGGAGTQVVKVPPVRKPAGQGKHPGGMTAPRGKPAAKRGLTFRSQVRRPGIGFHPALLAAAAHGAAHGAAVVAPIQRKKGSARAIGGDESCGPGIG